MDAHKEVTAALNGHRALYSPSAVAEAAQLLTDLAAVMDQHGVPPSSSARGWLVTAAAESVGSRHGRPARTRTPREVAALADGLAAECQRLGLVGAAMGGMGFAAEPVPGGPVWGWGRCGLAVRVYADAGWELVVNQERSPAVGVYAPASPAGAREVAGMLADIMHGRAPDPFTRR